jgi:hypothetical protein
MLGIRDHSFATFQARLLDEVRGRIRNGEFTERGLARLAGISQPHLHNLLKGVRELTSASADSLLATLDVGLLQLASADELGEALQAKGAAGGNRRIAPLLDGRVGPGWPIPDARQPAGWRPLPLGSGNCGRKPVMVFLAPDPALGAAFAGVAVAVIDLDEQARVLPTPHDWYLVRQRGAGLIRQVRVESDRVEILGQLGLASDHELGPVPLGSASILHVVRGRLVWVGRDPSFGGGL